MFRRFSALVCIGLVVCWSAGGCDKAAPETVPAKAEQPASEKGTPSSDGPRWSCKESIIDFGSVWEGETVERSFKFHNLGLAPLKIEKPKAHCSCSSSDNYTKEVLPGGIGYIPFVLRTANKPFGKLTEYLDIQTNDPTMPKTRVWLKGMILKVCELEVVYDASHERAKAAGGKKPLNKKAKASFGRIKADDQLHRVIRLHNTSGAPLELTMVPMRTGSQFLVEFKEIEPGQEFELTVRGVSPFRVGYNTAQIVFQTNVPDRPVLKVQAYAHVPPRIEVVPQKIVINRDNPQNRPRSIRIKNHGTTPIRITSLAASDPRYKLELISPDPDNPSGHRVNVYFPGTTYRPPTYAEVIRIGTDDPEMPLIELRVLPFIRKPATPRPPDKPLELYPTPLSGSAG